MRTFLWILAFIAFWYGQSDAIDCCGKCIPKRKKCKFPCPEQHCPHGDKCCFQSHTKHQNGCVKPGLCPPDGPFQTCTFCNKDWGCGGAEKCCKSCCTGNLITDAKCTDKHGNTVGKCVVKECCKPPHHVVPDGKCRFPTATKNVVCCSDKVITPKPPTPKPPTPKPPTRPGICPPDGPFQTCKPCNNDAGCPSPEKCCHNCCTGNLKFPKCKDKKTKQIGECVSPMDCRPPKIVLFGKCPRVCKHCVCCLTRSHQTPPPTKPPPTKPPKGKMGKCPNVPRPCIPKQCTKDSDCKGNEKCCEGCCVRPIICSSKDKRTEGLCVHPEDCRPPYKIDFNIECFTAPHERKCVCCVLKKTTPPPPHKTCTLRLGKDTWTGNCVPKHQCGKGFVKCKKGNKQCKPHVCCFKQGEQPFPQTCGNKGK